MVEKVLLCSEDEYGIWRCRNDEESYNFVDYSEYDIATDLLLATSKDIGGSRDVEMLIDMLKKWNKKSPRDYDDIIGMVEDCMEEVDNGNYCVMKSIEDEAKEEIKEFARDVYGDEFVDDYLDEMLDETEMYYNYIDWGCSSEPEEGLCNAVGSVMNNSVEKECEFNPHNMYECDIKLPDSAKKVLDRLYEEWKEENEEE